MAGKEIIYETFYTRAPGQETLRKTAAARVRFLLREGWHEMERAQVGPDSIQVRFEREGAARPLEPLRKKPEPPPRRRPREGRGGGPPGRGGGPPGRGGGPPGRGGGPPGRGGGPSRGAPGGAGRGSG